MELIAVSSRLIRPRAGLVALCLTTALAIATPAHSQAASDPSVQASPPTLVENGDDDAVLTPAEPDFVVVNLPSTLRLSLFKSNFRLTHRFAGNLRSGSFSKRGITVTADQANAIVSNLGGFYLNIHTAANPNGVARGQLTRVQ